MYTKTIEIKTDWLSEIDGKSVADAIAYLQTLEQSHVLDCYIEGDTHGCQIVTLLTYQEPMTNQEIYGMLEKRYLKEIKLYTEAKQRHVNNGSDSRVENCDKMLQEYTQKLADAKAKYLEK